MAKSKARQQQQQARPPAAATPAQDTAASQPPPAAAASQTPQAAVNDKQPPTNPKSKAKLAEPAAAAKAGGDPVKAPAGRSAAAGNMLATRPANVKIIKSEATPVGCTAVKLVSNFVGITEQSNYNVYQYRIEFEPQLESRKLRSRLLFHAAEKAVFQSKLVFDGMYDARSPTVLKKDPTNVVAETPEGQKIQISIKKVGIVKRGAFEDIRLYNMDMNKFLRKLGYVEQHGRKYVDPETRKRVGEHKISLLRGYKTAANIHDDKRILMNLEPVHKLWQDENVKQMMDKFATRIKSQRQPQNFNFELAIEDEFRERPVVTKFNHACYKIESIRFDKHPTSMFELDGKPTSFIDYFKSRYNVIVKDRTGPMLQVQGGSSKRSKSAADDTKTETLLPPELCHLASFTKSQKEDFRLQLEYIRTCQLQPQQHDENLRKFMAKFHGDKEIRQILDRWGYDYERSPKGVKGFVLPTQAICWKPGQDKRSWPLVDPRDGSFERHIFREQIAVKPCFEKLVILCAPGIKPDKQRILNIIKEGFDKIGLRPNNAPMLVDIEDDRLMSYTQALKRVPTGTNLVLVLVDKQNKSIYDAIKKECTVNIGVPTQVITRKLMMDDRKARGAANKIAIQVAAKVGGEPWHIDLPLQQTMVCGYDTYHDTLERGRSYGAFIASTNAKCSKWFSRVNRHDKLDELSTNLAEDLSASVKNWMFKNNNNLPTNVILFRDGVGDGQIEHVFKVELNQAKEQLSKFTSKAVKSIKLTVIIVSKRIGARFYVEGQNSQPASNPIPGTVVDNTVTREGRYDFYLVSQSTRQGTITPTYYNVIYDESGLRPEQIQMIAFKMCLNYYNWTGGVRVPAPCQYAHKLAFQTGTNTHRAPHVSLSNSLHYL